MNKLPILAAAAATACAVDPGPDLLADAKGATCEKVGCTPETHLAEELYGEWNFKAGADLSQKINVVVSEGDTARAFEASLETTQFFEAWPCKWVVLEGVMSASGTIAATSVETEECQVEGGVQAVLTADFDGDTVAGEIQFEGPGIIDIWDYERLVIELVGERAE